MQSEVVVQICDTLIRISQKIHVVSDTIKYESPY